MDKKVTINTKSENIEEVLNMIFVNTGLNYKILDKQVVIYEAAQNNVNAATNDSRSSIQEEQQKRRISGTITDEEVSPSLGQHH